MNYPVCILFISIEILTRPILRSCFYMHVHMQILYILDRINELAVL